MTLFKRDRPLTIAQHVRELFWPSMGWRRALRYVYLRIIRLSDSAHSIALGLAIGAAMAFNPFLGTHFIQAATLSWILRGNILCAMIGTFVGNPWTFPFIWLGGIEFGTFLFGFFGFPAAARLPSHIDVSVVWDLIVHHPTEIFLPWMMGGYILGFAIMPIVYITSYPLVVRAKHLRNKRRVAL